MKKVSIILTTYKGHDNIYSCVESALKQDYKNIELIIVDDNGIGTKEQILTYQKIEQLIKNGSVKYIMHEKNMNGSVARNTGIKNAKGEYIAFLDDDDVLYENSISLRVNALEEKNNEYGLVMSSYCIKMAGRKDKPVVYNFDGEILLDFLLQKIQSPSSILMVRKKVIDDIGLWDESFQRHQDWEFVCRVCYKYKACAVRPNYSRKK